MPTPNRFARRSTPLLTLAAAVGIVLSIIIAEMAVRVLLPSKAPSTERAVFLQYDSLLGWSHKPGQRARFVQYDFQVDVSINRLGLRDSEYSARKGGRHRLLVIGYSFAWGFGVEHDERFTEVLEQRHPEWEVINAAVNGYGTDQELLYLEGRGMSLDPDVVLLLVHPNDFENNVASEQYWYFKPRFTIDGDEILLGNVPVPRATVEQRRRRLILGRTYLGQVLAGAWRRVKSVPGQQPGENPGNSVLKGAALTERLLRQIYRVCHTEGAEFVLVSVPIPQEGRSILTRVATENGIPFLALDSTFENGGSSPPLTFPHDEHWTAQGTGSPPSRLTSSSTKRASSVRPTAARRSDRLLLISGCTSLPPLLTACYRFILAYCGLSRQRSRRRHRRAIRFRPCRPAGRLPLRRSHQRGRVYPSLI